jgi:putative nucleotidyltransferase with HDIG domain
MYIHSLDCDWMAHAFLRNQFMLRKEADLQRILASGATSVYIDTLKGLDLGNAPAAPAAGSRTSHLEELAIAKQIKREADTVIHALFTDARMGRQIRVERLEPVVTRITDSILRNPGTLVSLYRLREADLGTFQHSVSSCALLIMFAHHLRLDRTILHEAGVGGMLHDIGKMRVPDHILNKPSRLTEAENAIMRDHVRLGLETLSQTPGVSNLVMQVAAEHHERLDGSGYPRRLKGLQISPLGRMATIVDVYDALTSSRIYHRSIEPGQALQRLYQDHPGEFDADLVQHFIQAIGIYPVGSLVRLESNRLAVVMQQNHGGPLRPVVRVVYDIGHGRLLPPFDLDLTGPESAGDGVLGHEPPAAWNLDPNRFLTMEL